MRANPDEFTILKFLKYDGADANMTQRFIGYYRHNIKWSEDALVNEFFVTFFLKLYWLISLDRKNINQLCHVSKIARSIYSNLPTWDQDVLHQIFALTNHTYENFNILVNEKETNPDTKIYLKFKDKFTMDKFL